MRTRVKHKDGMVVICGKLTRSKQQTSPNGELRGTYELDIQNNSWLDPTGQKGAERTRWNVYARSFEARLADPNHYRKPEYLIIEGHLISQKGREGSLLWRERSGRPRKTINLRAKYVTDILSWEVDPYLNMITFHPQGTVYHASWRSYMEDTTPIVDDYEFMYEEERWSRDPD